MTQHAQTKDERFMIQLYHEANKSGDVAKALDRYVIGQLVGLQAKAVDTICVLLGKANFIRKSGEREVSLTSQGVRLVLELLSR